MELRQNLNIILVKDTKNRVNRNNKEKVKTSERRIKSLKDYNSPRQSFAVLAVDILKVQSLETIVIKNENLEKKECQKCLTNLNADRTHKILKNYYNKNNFTIVNEESKSGTEMTTVRSQEKTHIRDVINFDSEKNLSRNNSKETSPFNAQQKGVTNTNFSKFTKYYKTMKTGPRKSSDLTIKSPRTQFKSMTYQRPDSKDDKIMTHKSSPHKKYNIEFKEKIEEEYSKNSRRNNSEDTPNLQLIVSKSNDPKKERFRTSLEKSPKKDNNDNLIKKSQMFDEFKSEKKEMGIEGNFSSSDS